MFLFEPASIHVRCLFGTASMFVRCIAPNKHRTTIEGGSKMVPGGIEQRGRKMMFGERDEHGVRNKREDAKALSFLIIEQTTELIYDHIGT